MRAGKAALATGVLLAACATTPDPQQVLRAPADDAYAIASSLVSEVGPRFAGTEGDARAVGWALAKLQTLGFSNVRAEPVTVPRWQRGELRLELAGSPPQILEAVAVGGSVPTPAGGVAAEVVAVPSFEALEALPGEAVKGRIVFINGRMTRERDGSGYGKAVRARSRGPRVAGQMGAVAVLIRSVGTDAEGWPHTGATFYKDDQPKIPGAALSGAGADRLEEALARGRARVRLTLTSRAAGEAQSANVVGEIPGELPEIVLLCAHLDSWDITPGANDDAAGVGIVVAAARRVAALGKPRRTVRVVLFANEEYGVDGSKAYAAAHSAELARHVVAMESDAGSGAVWRLSAGVAPADWAFVAEQAAQLGLETGQNGSDGHADVEALRKLGVPEIIATQDASRYFDVHHTREDTVDKLDRAGLAQATGIVAALTHAASERSEGFVRLPPPPASP